MMKSNNCIFTICAKNYVGLAQILEKSVLKYNKNVDFYIVVADEYGKDDPVVNDNDILIAHEFLNIDDKLWTNMAFKYNLTEFCTCIKPFSIEYFFVKKGYDTVCYLDPDIYLFSDFSYIYEKLDKFLVVTAPHITIPDYPYSGDTPDRGFLFNGISNFGFVGFKNSPKTLNVIRWWEDRLSKLCFGEMLWAVCTDQKWSDFFMAFFDYDEIFFSNNLGLNVAPWNYFERKVTKKGDTFYVESRKGTSERMDKLVFCHFAGYNYKQLAEGKVDNKSRMRISNLKSYQDIDELVKIYVNEIHKNKDLFAKYLSLSYSYGTFSNGVKIEAFHRRLYNGLCVNFNFEGNPFVVDTDNSFYSLLKGKHLLPSSQNVNVDKMNPENIDGFGKKLSLLYKGLRFFYKLIGYKNYVLFLQFIRRLSLYDINTFLLGKEFENQSLRMKE